MQNKKIFLSLILMFNIFLLSACSFTKEEVEINEEEIVEEEPYNIEEVIKEYKPNELGDIPVIMYHAILENPPSVYQRSVEGFKEDLTYMYEHNYVTISNSDYINFNINVPAGKTPILITFDDGEPGTFDLVKNDDGSYSPRKDTAIYLMEEFYKEHPDFGKNAILYINGHQGTFNDELTDQSIPLEDKINWLFDNGYEVSNHTSGHLNMSKSTNEEIQKEIAQVDKQIKTIRPDAVLNSIAYPFGARPKEGNDHVITNGSYDGYNYSYQIGFREGPSRPRFYPVICNDFDPMNVPRLRGNKGELGDMWSYFEQYDQYPNQRFISDGNNKIITIPDKKESLIDYNKVKDLSVVVYNSETLEVINDDNSNTNETVNETKVLY